jgi:murein DD-endopeptidase MepM/ murein hydrolase activator NlpD
MRCSTTGPVWAKRAVRLAGAVALAGLSAACSADMSRFGPTTTGSTGGSHGSSAMPYSRPTEPVQTPSDSVQTSQLPPAGGYQPPANGYQGGGAYQSAGNGYNAGGYAPASAPATTPSYGAGSGSQAAGGTVTVREGQTLYAVARENGVSVNQLVALNGLTPPYSVRAGQVLRLPAGGSSAASAYGGGSTGMSSAPAVASASGGIHTVKPGETIYSLGRTYGVSPQAIASANGFSMDHQLRVGETVRLPGSAGSGASAPATRVASLDPNAAVSATQPAPGPSTLGKIPANATGQPLSETVAAAKADAAAPTVPPSAPASAPANQQASLEAPATKSAGTSFRWPVKGRVISKFGEKPNGSRNDGINISVPEGTSVRASEDGVVAYAGNELKGYGNLVLIRHDGGWVTAYAHNSELLVKRGDQVKRGDVIAKAGATGSVTSPQVHFEIRKGAQAVDPMSHLGSSVVAGD